MTALIQSFGPFGVFLLMVPESACIPVPGEVTLIFSGFAVSQHWLSFALAVLAATAGNLAGSFVSLPAGARRIPLAPFVLLTGLGCALWAVLFVVLGVVSGSAWSEVSSLVGKVLLGVGLAVVALLGVPPDVLERPDRVWAERDG